MPIFNTFPYNTRPFNGLLAQDGVFSSELVVFNSYELALTNGILIQDINESGHVRQINRTDIARDDGFIHDSDYLREKIIPIRGLIKKDTQVELEAFLDTFKQKLYASQGNLDITRTGMTGRRYIATLMNMDKVFQRREKYHITICPFDLEFLCKFGHDRTYTLEAKQIITSPDTHTFDNDGSFTARPIIIVVFNAASSITQLNVKNDTNSDEMQIVRTWSAGDSLVIDGENYTVEVNGTAVDFSGVFPKLDVGSNTLRYTVTGSSFDAMFTVKFKQRYL